METKKAVIIGYGFTAQSIDAALNQRDYDVVGVRRNWAGNEEDNVSSETIEANLTDRSSLDDLPPSPEIVINCASAGSRGDTERYEDVYLRGAKNLLDWARDNNPDHILWTGSTSVYGQQNGDWVTEESETDPQRETGRILVETEECYRSARSDGGFETTILRCTGIYGEGRARSLDQFLNGDNTLSLDKANKYLNMINREDIAHTVATLLEQSVGNETFNVTDNEPVTRRHFYVWLSQQLDRPLPKLSGRGSQHPRGNKRVSNAKLHEYLNLSLNYPNYKEGYRPILRKRGLID
ncbi:MAG: NAD-dependent epimerase/dehydratase family protein [bacterium]